MTMGNESPVAWCDALEKDFDKAFVSLDLLLGEIDSDQVMVFSKLVKVNYGWNLSMLLTPKSKITFVSSKLLHFPNFTIFPTKFSLQVEITYEGRQKMTSLSGSFAQLMHKAQSMHHALSRYEKVSQLQIFPKEARADRDAMEKEMQQLMLQGNRFIANQLHDVLMPSLRTECELEVLRKESDRQRHLIGALETEVFGARLAAKYLDKVGRIQQIQLLGRNMRGVEHDRLWNQLEAEIHLHRHKTVIRACR
ncbi:unnamed protein product [Strongylus vulgaris]|uniref:Uncharacterized protein n=1 Tax=Strongylus vulgaris TaxID=40348 RepID=A0A3P7LGS3_STRVU|nr:unnamed protein product [Strongylus vulgaris]